MNSLRIICLTASILGCFSVLGCATDLIGKKADLSAVETPTGLAVHPGGRYAYVTGSNFDLDYRATDGGAIYVVDLETNQVVPNASKRMGSFGTNIVLSSDGRRGYTVTRDDDALVWFEISEDGSQISCPESPESEDLLDCRIILDDDPTHIAITRSYREKKMIDANGVETTKRVEFDLLMVAQMRNARITAVTVQENEKGLPEFSHETASFVYSASEVLWIGGERFVVTGRAATNLLVISPAIDEDGKVKGLYASQGVVVPNGAGVYQGRGMTLDPTGQNLYLLNQYPKSLMKFDVTGLSKNDAASDKAVMTDMMMLPYDMLKAAWIGDAENGFVYLTSVENDSIYIVNPRQMAIASVIDAGDGPYDMALDGNRLFVLNFLGENISEFDVSDPAAPVLVRDYLTRTETDSTEKN